MPGLLSRSKSMRLLTSHRGDAQQEGAQKSMPRSGNSQTDIDRYLSATPISKKERDVETPNMVPRPSTSGGPGDRRTLFHMKTNPVASNHSQNDLPSSLPLNSTTFLSTARATDSSEGIIGIALGSPTVDSYWTGTPQASVLNAASQSTDNMSAFSQPYSPAPSAVRTVAPKSKLSRWKSMFKKAAPPPPQPEKPSFYKLTTTVTATRAGRADSHHDEEAVKSVRQYAEPMNDRTPSPPTFKPNIRASRTFTTPRIAPSPPQTRPRAFTATSLPANPRVSVVRSATTPIPSNMVANDFPAVPRLFVSQSAQQVPTLTGDGKPLLDVSIPDIKLDRYSVMFGNLLQPASSNRSSSLLVRRQGNTDKLKPLNKLSVKEQEQESPIDYRLQRRATSPVVPSPSPRLSLFPSTSTSNSRAPSPRALSVPRSKKLHRSKTAPEKSPLCNTFSRDELASEKGQNLFILKPTASPKLKPQASMNLKVQQLAITPTSVHSFESDTDSITIFVGRTTPGQPLHLDDREPEWEICSKPAPIKRSNTTPLPDLVRKDSQRKQPAVTKLSALSSHPSSAPLETPSPLQRIQQLQSPPQSAHQEPPKENTAPKAMVGVARSVSVSRANSPRTLVRTASELRSPKDRDGSPRDRLVVDRQALTPTMVEVRNRKSQRVQLVDA